ncbi:MAG: N-acetylmuramoyl-L-alanine amidase [Rhizobiaceae bacterium]
MLTGRADIRFATPFKAISTAVMAIVLVVVGLSAAFAASSDPGRTEARGLKIAGDSSRVRLVLHLDREVPLRWFFLRGPHRLVIDLTGADLIIDPRDAKPRGLLSSVRFGPMGDKDARLVLAAKGPFVVEKADIVENEDAGGSRLVVDIAAAPNEAFEAALAEQTETTGSTKGDRVLAGEAISKPFTIVIDPGHGGIDSGAEGGNGTLEKTITLAFALELRAKLLATTGYRVEMTRDDDEFLRLDDRVRIARQQGADLLISIHADTIRLKGIRGATVYTVSDQASDAEAAALAARENLADAIGGVDIAEDNQEVADILIDLIRRETHSFSVRFARSLVGELTAGKVELINNPHRSAGFKVLRAPDVPSVLVELGYLSNPHDEEMLRSPEWRGRAIDSIAAAIMLFSAARRGAGG